MELVERAAELARDPAVGPFSITIGGEGRIEADGQGRIAVVRPTPQQLGAPTNVGELPGGDEDASDDD
jgi:hypothetical protein